MNLGNTYSSLCLEGAKRHNFNTPRAPNVQWPMSNSALICGGEGCDSCQIFFAASPPPTASLSAPSLLHDSLSGSSHGTQSTLFPHHLLSISLAAASLLLKEHFILYLIMLSWHNEDGSVLHELFLQNPCWEAEELHPSICFPLVLKPVLHSLVRLTFHHALPEQLQSEGSDPPQSLEILHFLKLDSYHRVLLKLLKTLTAKGSSHVQMPRKQRCCPEHLPAHLPGGPSCTEPPVGQDPLVC